MILSELQAVIPASSPGWRDLTAADAGSSTSSHRPGRRALGPATGPDRRAGGSARPVGPPHPRRWRRGRPAGGAAVESGASSEAVIRRSIEALGDTERATLLADLIGERTNRRHRPGRGFEALRYRFEIVADYGPSDLQRHRMLTVQCSADAGPGRRRARAGGARRRRRALPPRARRLPRPPTNGWRTPGSPAPPPTHSASATGCGSSRSHAREAMQLIELRSGREGHPGYRAVAHEMHAQIAAVHPAVAGAMTTWTSRPSRAWSASCPRCAPRPAGGLSYLAACADAARSGDLPGQRLGQVRDELVSRG